MEEVEVIKVEKKKKKWMKEMEQESEVPRPAKKKQKLSQDDLTSVEAMFNKEEELKSMLGFKLFKPLKRMGFTKLTSIQFRTFPHIECKKDVVGIAKTGSGKTLAFLLPVLKNLTHFPVDKGTGAIVVSPTRELSQQTYNTLAQLATGIVSHGLLMGGKNMQEEAELLRKGVCFLVATPGRLLDHLKNTLGFKYNRLQTLILDETDKLLDGFQKTIEEISQYLPRKKQTLMFTATFEGLTVSFAPKVLKDKHIIISTLDSSSAATVFGLQQTYMVKTPLERLPFLCQLLLHLRSHKVMVFFGGCRSAEFHHLLLSRWNSTDLRLFRLHSNMTPIQRNTDAEAFHKETSGVLLCTDVAARGLDIVNVDMIIQYEPPQKTQSYIHRVGRTARGLAGVGSALLLLQPGEEPYVEKLKESNIPIEEHPRLEMEGDPTTIYTQLKNLVDSDPDKLQDLAFLAFHAYYRHYRLCVGGFKMENLKAPEVAGMFLLPFTPQLVYELSERKTKQRRKYKLPVK